MPDEYDAHFLRLAFERAVADQEAWKKNPMVVWHDLYLATIMLDAGLAVRERINELEAQNEKLQAEVDRLNSLIERPASLPVMT